MPEKIISLTKDSKIHVTDHFDLYRALTPEELEFARYASGELIDYSSSGQAVWDMRNDYIEVIDGKGRKRNISLRGNEDTIREYVFAEHQKYMDWTSGGLTNRHKDPRDEKYEKELEESRTGNKGLIGWVGRHKKATAGIISGLILGGIGLGIALNEKKIKEWIKKTTYDHGIKLWFHELPPAPKPTSTYKTTLDICVEKYGEPLDYHGLKICGGNEFKSMVEKDLNFLKQKSPEHYKFVMDNAEAVVEEDLDYIMKAMGKSKVWGGADRPGKTILIDDEVINDSACVMVHEAKHIEGYGEKEAGIIQVECAKKLYSRP